MISFYGSHYYNWLIQQEFGDQPPGEHFENYWQQSPLSWIDNANTPTLIVHGEGVLVCPVEQGEQMFVALKRVGVETEMIRYPEEPHGMAIVSRIDRLERMRTWFDCYRKEGRGA